MGFSSLSDITVNIIMQSIQGSFLFIGFTPQITDKNPNTDYYKRKLSFNWYFQKFYGTLTHDFQKAKAVSKLFLIDNKNKIFLSKRTFKYTVF